MGVSLKGLYDGETIELKSLSGKIIAVDAYNMLYQFLTTIRGYDGAALMDSKGRVTSHIQGLFSRVTALMQMGMKLAFVFDGQPPDLKAATLEERKLRKAAATQKYAQALAAKDVDGMHTYAKQTTVLTKEMAQQAKDVLQLLGIPVVQAPSEGEAQAAHMCKQGLVDYISSQDADALLFGAPVIVRNLSIYGKRKVPGKQQWVTVEPQRIVLTNVLSSLGLSQQQLIFLGMLVGTDYAPGGVKGIGPKNALKLVKQYTDPEQLFSEAKWSDHQEVPWKNVFELFIHMPVQDIHTISWNAIQYDALSDLLVKEYEFSSERVTKTLDGLKNMLKEKQQKGLAEFF